MQKHTSFNENDGENKMLLRIDKSLNYLDF